MLSGQALLKNNLEFAELPQYRWCPSPHYNARPPESLVELLVIHNISLPPSDFTTNSVESFFLGKLDYGTHDYFSTLKGIEVSSHFFIRRQGELIQFVDCHDRAWHAGESNWRGKTQCNDFSIGIELEGTDDIPFEPIQYQQLSHLIKKIQALYPAILNDHIVGHSDIAPHRKTDPGPCFDWDYLWSLLKQS